MTWPKCLNYVQSIPFADDSTTFLTHSSLDELQKAISSDLFLLETWLTQLDS